MSLDSLYPAAAVAVVLGLILWSLTSSSKPAVTESKPANKKKAKKPAAPKAEVKETKAEPAPAKAPEAGKKGKKAKAEEPKPEEKAAAPVNGKKGKAAEKPAEKVEDKAETNGKKKKKNNNNNSKPKKETSGEVEEEAPKKSEDDGPPTVSMSKQEAANMDGWEVAAVGPKKNAKRRERIEAERQAAKSLSVKNKVPTDQKAIPGMAPVLSPADCVAATLASCPKVSQAVAANAKVKADLAAAGAAVQEGDDPNMTTFPVRVPEKAIGRIIGPKGATLKLIQEKTGVTKIDTNGDVFTLIGSGSAVSMAAAAIKELAEKGFSSLQFEDFDQAGVMAHPRMFPEIIGKQGSIIRKIKEELSVEVSIPETPRDAVTKPKKFKVGLAGSRANVAKAKEVIESILKFYHHDITHEGMVHEEVTVEPYQLNWIIGRGGSEIRHIQGNFKVKLYIPNEFSSHSQPLIVGEESGVTRAKAYIEKVIYNAENAPSSRDSAEGANDGDGWGEEEGHEEWMNAYLYKRR